VSVSIRNKYNLIYVYSDILIFIKMHGHPVRDKSHLVFLDAHDNVFLTDTRKVVGGNQYDSLTRTFIA
jgi:hypothetical protein